MKIVGGDDFCSQRVFRGKNCFRISDRISVAEFAKGFSTEREVFGDRFLLLKLQRGFKEMNCFLMFKK